MIQILLKYPHERLVAIIDERDRALTRWSWHVVRAPNGKFYARRAGCIYLHREIMDAPSGIEVDHKNGDSLDCRRRNLRLATRQQNMQNAGRPSHNTSGFKGVARCKHRWRAYIKKDQRQIHLGLFDDAEAAARAYDVAARELFGEFARTNFP